MKTTKQIKEKHLSAENLINKISEQMNERGILYDNADKFYYIRDNGEQSESTLKQMLDSAYCKLRTLAWVLDIKL